MAGRGDDDDVFGKIFGRFFGPRMDDEFRELTKQMDEMFQNLGFGDINIANGNFGPAPPPGGRSPPLESPRDQMLKDPTTDPSKEQAAPCQTGQCPGTNAPTSQPFRYSFRFSPFGSPDQSTFDNTRLGEDDRVSGQPTHTDSFVTSWRSSWNESSTKDGSGWNKRVVQTVVQPDGTVEKIEKTTQNGRTCTTTTTTDPHGVTTTNTVCDKPPIEGTPLKDTPAVDNPNSTLGPMKPVRPVDPGYSKEDIGFFKKMFGFDIFKPRN